MNPRKLMLALGALLSLGLAVPTVAIAQTAGGSSAESDCDNVLVGGFDDDGDDEGLLGGLLGGDDEEDDEEDRGRNSEGDCLDGAFERSRSGFNEDDDDDDGLLGGLLDDLLGGDDEEDEDLARSSQRNGSNGSGDSNDGGGLLGS